MKNAFSLQKRRKTSNIDTNLADFMPIKIKNPKLKQSELANQLSYTSSTLQRYKIDINMFSPYRIQSIITNIRSKQSSKTNFDNN